MNGKAKQETKERKKEASAAFNDNSISFNQDTNFELNISYLVPPYDM
jgi:hypothetical protein